MPGFGPAERALFEDDATKLYEEICARGGISASDDRIAEDGELRPAFDLLVGMGLVIFDSEQDAWTPEDPTGVQSRIVSPLSQEAARLLSESSQWSSAFSNLSQTWRRAPQSYAGGPFTYLRDSAIDTFLEEAVAECEEETLTAQPQAGRDPRFLAMAALRDIEMLERGVKMRTLLKPDPRTAVTGGTLMARIFEEAGLPAGVLQMLPGGKDVGEALVTDPHVRVISFTGSTAVGRSIGELAGRHLKRAHLELGGNSALLILDDADVEKAVGLTGWASFLNQGQICMTTGRYFVADRIYDDFVDQLAAKAGHLPVGDPSTEQVALGPVIDERSRDKIHGLVTSSVDQGARLAAGGEYDRLFYRPTVLADVPLTSPVFTEEVFGPVAPVTRVPSVEEAVRLASDSDYGLSLGIVTRDVMRGLALAERIPTGIVHINDQTVNDEANVPFGGVGASGLGRLGGAAANIEAFTETRWITMRGEPASYPF